MDQNFFVSGHQTQKNTYPENCSVSCFSSSGMHQSHHLDGCQAMGKSSSFIEAF